MGGEISDRPSADEAGYLWRMIPDGTAVERGARPSAHGRSEIFPAMNRLLTPAGNVRSDGDQPRDGTAPSSFAPEPPLFFCVFSTLGEASAEYPSFPCQEFLPLRSHRKSLFLLTGVDGPNTDLRVS